MSLSMFSPLKFRRGPALDNRFVLAPLTNCQSNADGTLAAEEYDWLTRRATGGFGLVTTCASHVQACGQGFPNQLGCFDDKHLDGLKRLADGLRAAGAVSSLQLHHAGMRAVQEAGESVAPSDDAQTGARGLTGDEVEQLIADFIAAALRAEKAGFDGVQIHGAHGYILAQFLSPTLNRRTDDWGGSYENRVRILWRVLDGIHAACGPDFQIGLRLSPERFGLELPEMLRLAKDMLACGKLDYLDMSLWDFRKQPEDKAFEGKTLMQLFTDLPRHGTALGVAGKIMTAADCRAALEAGADYVAIGRAGIIAHDMPKRVQADPSYTGPVVPVPADMLRDEGVSDVFVSYLRRNFGALVAAE